MNASRSPREQTPDHERDRLLADIAIATALLGSGTRPPWLIDERLMLADLRATARRTQDAALQPRP